LLRENLKQSPDYIASRLSLAAALEERGDNAAAIEEYRKILAAKPTYVAAHLALAGLLVKTKATDEAIQELREVVKQDPQSFASFEQIGDLEAARQHPAEAKAAYEAALPLAPDRSARKRINGKLGSR